MSNAAEALAEALREGTASEFGGGRETAPTLASGPASSSPDEQNAPRLHNQRKPSVEIVHEKPHHLVIAYMVASGMSQKEIALRQGVTEVHISNLCRQPWFINRVVDIISESGRDAVETIIKGAAVDSVMKIIYLRDHAKSETVVMNSAIHLLDRHLGKATQPISKKNDQLDDPVAEAARLERELEALEAAEHGLATN